MFIYCYSNVSSEALLGGLVVSLCYIATTLQEQSNCSVVEVLPRNMNVTDTEKKVTYNFVATLLQYYSILLRSGIAVTRLQPQHRTCNIAATLLTQCCSATLMQYCEL